MAMQTHKTHNYSLKHCIVVCFRTCSLLLYMDTHTHANNRTDNTAGHSLRWTHQPWQTDRMEEKRVGREERVGWKEGRRLTFSSALEKSVLVAKLSALFFHSFLLIKPTLFPYPHLSISLYNHCLSNRPCPTLVPISLPSLLRLFIIPVPLWRVY